MRTEKLSIEEYAKLIYKNNTVDDIKSQLEPFGYSKEVKLSKKCLALILAEKILLKAELN